MSEPKFLCSIEGQEVEQDDINLLGEEAALADDRVLAELFRLAPYDGSTYSRCIIPYDLAGTVQANGASGSVKVNPFRAIIGSRTLAGTDSKANWRDVRSTIFLYSGTALAGSVSLAANSSGNPRWDLVYAAVAVDANGPSLTRYAKAVDATSVTPSAIVTTKRTTVTVAVVTGTTGASPVFPSLPSDSGGTWYVPLAYVRVPTGWSGTSTVDKRDIAVVEPVLPIHPVTGAASARPASMCNKPGLLALSTAKQGTWGATGGATARPKHYVPSSFVGEETIWLPIYNASAGDIPNGTVLDDSRDWRGRLFTATVSCSAATGPDALPWDNLNPASSPTAWFGTSGETGASGTAHMYLGLGQSIKELASATSGWSGLANASPVFELYSTMPDLSGNTLWTGSEQFVVYVDFTDGKLKLWTAGTPTFRGLIKLTASGRFFNSHADQSV